MNQEFGWLGHHWYDKVDVAKEEEGGGELPASASLQLRTTCVIPVSDDGYLPDCI